MAEGLSVVHSTVRLLGKLFKSILVRNDLAGNVDSQARSGGAHL